MGCAQEVAHCGAQTTTTCQQFTRLCMLPSLSREADLRLIRPRGGEVLQGRKAPPVQLVGHLGDLGVQGQALHLGSFQLSSPLFCLHTAPRHGQLALH